MAAVARVFRGCRFLMSPAAPGAAGAKKPVAAAGAQAAAAKPKVKRGITMPVPVSDALRRFAGADHVSRSGAMKIVWDHIKAKGLQNPAKKSEIICDEKLKSLFGEKDKVGMLEIAKLLSPHFVKK